MDIHDVTAILRKQWWVIALVATAVLAVVAYSTMTAERIYKSTATVFVALSLGNTPNELFAGSTYVQGQMQTYSELLRTPQVLDPVVEELGLPTTGRALSANVSARTNGQSALLSISASSPNPATAAAVANAAAASLAETAQALSPTSVNGRPPVQLTTVREASPPGSPSSPNTRRNLMMGLIAGLLLGIGAGLLRHYLDRRLRSVADVEALTQLPVLAEVLTERSKEGVVMVDRPTSVESEAYRRLRTNTQFLEVEQQQPALVITSADAGEGKSTVAVNLAFACAYAGDRVLLIDGDLRKPTISKKLGLVGSAGLTTVLAGRATLDDVLQTAGGDYKVDVLTSGVIPPNPAELLGSVAMQRLLDRVQALYDVILIDAPPLLPVTDGAILARQVSGALLVARLQVAQRDRVVKAESELQQAGARCLGLIVNGVGTRKGSGNYRYEYYGASRQPRKKQVERIAR